MTGESWSESARLTKLPVHGRGWMGARGAHDVMTGTLAELTRHIAAQDSDELWRYTIITADEHYIRAAELRDLLRRDDLPA